MNILLFTDLSQVLVIWIPLVILRSMRLGKTLLPCLIKKKSLAYLSGFFYITISFLSFNYFWLRDKVWSPLVNQNCLLNTSSSNVLLFACFFLFSINLLSAAPAALLCCLVSSSSSNFTWIPYFYPYFSLSTSGNMV